MTIKKVRQHGILEHLLVLGMAAMCLMVFGNVVLRYVFDSGLQFSEEVSRFVFVWLTFVGSIVALKDGIHLGIDSLLRRLPAKPRIVCYWISHLLMLWCCGLLWIGSWEQTRLNLHNLAPVSGIPIAMLYGSGLVASAFMALILLNNLWQTIKSGMSARGQADENGSAEGLASERGTK